MEFNKITFVVEIIAAIIGLIGIWINANVIIVSSGFLGLCLIVLALIFALILLPESIKETKINETKIKMIVWPFFKYAGLLLILASFLDYLREWAGELDINTVGFWHFAFFIVIMITPIIERGRESADNAMDASASHNPPSLKHP